MNDDDRKTATKRWCQDAFDDANVTANMTAADVKAAVAAIDDALDAQCSTLADADTLEVALNKKLPEPFKTNATQAQKGLVMAITLGKRYGFI